MGNPFPLSKVPVGRKVRVTDLKLEGFQRRRMLDIGLVPGTEVKVIRRSPIGDPTAYLVRGAIIGLRRDEASKVLVDEN
ncbi:ferrous iron transport protein A [Heliobacterium gestii]|uniref:Ferrous iron transport protein A n=1 Tax=Heliomicrobium gestii TaxID=2699 RepID=A0A845LA57_HELGE|nr:FeoA family protein [Heliomicrobium gestii]MBM7867350.1 ferrous iron transport protein A [Heliomicrobium gestii]MZP43617.1 ferrous iron transport protein A [Heliomicrobium gestii]